MRRAAGGASSTRGLPMKHRLPSIAPLARASSSLEAHTHDASPRREALIGAASAFADRRYVHRRQVSRLEMSKKEEIRMRRPWLLSATVAITAVLSANNVASAQPAAGAEWRTPAGTVQGTRFSGLAQINATNVNRLQEDFRF